MKNNILSRMLPRLLAVALASVLAIGCAQMGVDDGSSSNNPRPQVTSSPVTVTIDNRTQYSVQDVHIFVDAADFICYVGYQGTYRYTFPSTPTGVTCQGYTIGSSYTAVTGSGGQTVYMKWEGNVIVIDTNEVN